MTDRLLKLTDEELVREVDDYGRGLSQWEVDFVADLVDRGLAQAKRDQRVFFLTPKQRAKLIAIAGERVQ